GEPRAVQIQIAVAPDAGFFYRRDAGLEARLRRGEGSADFFYLVVALLLPPVKKGVALHLQRKAARPQLVGEQRRKRRRHRDAANALFPEYQLDDVGRVGRRLAALSRFRGVARQRQHHIDVGLALGAVDLEVAHDDVLLPAVLEKDEWVGREKRRGIQHVGVALARGDDQKGILAAFHGKIAKLAILL